MMASISSLRRICIIRSIHGKVFQLNNQVPSTMRLLHSLIITDGHLPKNFLTPNSKLYLHRSANLRNDTTTNEILQLITKNINQISVDSLLYQRSSFQGVIQTMLNNGYEKDQIAKLFIDTPTLLSCQSSELENVLLAFLESGFTGKETIDMIKELPQLIESPEKVQAVFNVFNDLGITENKIRKMLYGCPTLFSEDPVKLQSTLSQLMGIFRKSDLTQMLRIDAGILLQSIKDIERKVNYVYHNMGLDQVEMAWASVLKHDLEFIRARHQLLVRTGRFEKPDKSGSSRIVNPYLKDILGTSDATFAKNIAGISLEEYQVFLKIMPMERQQLQNEFNDRFDSDDEEDVDSIENERGYKKEKVKKHRMRKQLLEYS